MSRKFWFVAVVFTVCALSATDVFARGRRRGYSSSNTGAHMEYVETAESTDKLYYNNTKSLQELAQDRANAMARLNVMSHEIHQYDNSVPDWRGVGVLEGIGYSSAQDPKAVSTCICGSRVVADAHCRSISGLIYRVRFFR